MTDQDLLIVAKRVLFHAIHEAEFTGKDKDVVYVNMVANKVEGLIAKMAGRDPCPIKMVMRNYKIYVDGPNGWTVY